MLGDDGEAKLLDFGLAKLVGERAVPREVIPLTVTSALDATASIARPPATESESTRHHLTADGALVGTPLYLAPELWRGEDATTRSDVYALGVLLWELLAGRSPHTDVTLAELPEHPIPSIASVVDGLPSRFAGLIDACVNRDPTARPADGDELCERLDARTATASFEGSPYRGLSTFHAEHRAVFFGRAGDVRAIVDRLRTETLVIVGGDSGAGKSSLCRAGVVPTIVERAFAGRSWTAATLSPGLHPLAALDAALATRTPDRGLLLLVDQLEELLTISDAGEVAAFAERLVALGAEPVRVLCTARTDFLGRLAGLPGLGALVGRALYLLGPLDTRGLREAVVGPALSVGYEFASSATVDELIASGRGSLPLLQFTLAELWDARDDRTHTIPADALTAIGGVAGALARRADLVMAALAAPDRELAWRVFLRLMTAEGTRATATRAELAELGGETERIVEYLIGARLLMHHGDGEALQVVHEALFSSWPRLAEWRRIHTDDARMRDQLAESARRWRERGEPAGLLWRGDALTDYRRWIARWHEPLSEIETRFAAASLALARRTRVTRIAIVASVLVGLATASVLLYRADHRTQEQRTSAELRNRSLLVQEGQRELEAGRSTRALVYFSDAMELGETGAGIRFLVARAMRGPSRDRGVLVAEPNGHRDLLWSESANLILTRENRGPLRAFDRELRSVYVRPTTDEIGSPAVSPDGRIVVAADEAMNLHVWDTTTWTETRYPAPTPTTYPSTQAPAFSPDGTHLAVSTSDSTWLWNLAEHRVVRIFQRPIPTGWAMPMFVHDGRELAVCDSSGVLRVWTVSDGREIANIDLHATDGSLAHYAWSCRLDRRGDRTYVAFDRTLRAYDRFDASPVLDISGHTRAISWFDTSPDGSELTTSSYDGTVKRWRTADGVLLDQWASPDRRTTAGVRYDSSGSRIAFVTDNGLVHVWDLASRRIAMTAEPPQVTGKVSNSRAGAHGVIFTADGRELLIASAVDIRRIAAGSDELAQEIHTTTGVNVTRWSPDGKRLAIASRALGVFDTDGTQLTSQGVGRGTIWDVAWTRDGKRIGIAGESDSDWMHRFGMLAEIRAVDGSSTLQLRGHTALVNRIVFSADESRVLTASSDRTVRIWDARTGAALASLPHEAAVKFAGWLPDGRIITATFEGRIRIWNGGMLDVVLVDTAHQILDGALDPAGARLAIAAGDGVVTIWDLAAGERVRTLLAGTGPMTSVNWSPDGELLACSSDDGTARVWDIDLPRPVASFSMRENSVFHAAWSPDGTRLAVSAGDGTAGFWIVERDTRSVEEIRRFVAEHIPWRLVDGTLVVR
jgi:WD40 repeat protein